MLSTLVLATTGNPRPELLSFLKSAPDLELVHAPLETANPPTSQTPDLVVLDASIPGSDDAGLLRGLKAQMPKARYLVLISSMSQSELLVTAGADRVLLVGFSAAEFFEVLTDLDRSFL